MPDLTPGQPQGGPATPTQPASPPLPIPGPPAAVADDDLSSLSPEEIQARLRARERDMKFRLQAIRHEAQAMGDDVLVGGRPLLDMIRERKEAAVGLAIGGGALVGILWGAVRRERRRPSPDDQIDFIRARMASLLDEAAQQVADGTAVDVAMQRALRSAPVVYVEPREPMAQAQRSAAQTIDVVVKSLFGYALKSVVDHLTHNLTSRLPGVPGASAGLPTNPPPVAPPAGAVR